MFGKKTNLLANNAEGVVKRSAYNQPSLGSFIIIIEGAVNEIERPARGDFGRFARGGIIIINTVLTSLFGTYDRPYSDRYCCIKKVRI